MLNALRVGEFSDLRDKLARQARPLGFLWGSAGLAVVFGALAQILFARQLGAESYGVLVSANAMANMLGPFAAWGVGLMLMQKHGAEGWAARRWVARSLQVFALWSAIAITVFAGWCMVAMETPIHKLAALLSAPLVFAFGAIQLAESRFQLEHDYFRVARWQLLKHLSIFSVAALTIVLGWSLLASAGGIFLASALTGGLAFWAGSAMMREGFALKGHGDRATIAAQPPRYREIISEAWPFAATSFGFLLLFQSSVTVVHSFAGASAAGVYGLAVSVMTAIYLLPRILYRKFFLAKVSRWHYHAPEHVAAFVTRLVPGVALLSIPLAAIAFVAAPALVRPIFGAEFAQTGAVLQVLSLAIPFRFLSAGMAIAAVETKHVRERVFWQFAIAGAAVIATIAVLPTFSIVGAAFVALVAEIALAAVYWWRAARRTGPKIGGAAAVVPVE